MPIPPRCSITEFVNSNCTAFVASLQRSSVLSHTELSPHPSPSPSVDLCSICALVQIFYCFLCTSQNSLSLAEHNCAPVKVSFHWLLRFSTPVVNYSIWVTSWRRYFQRNLFVERKIVYWLISVPCIESFARLPTQKVLVYWKLLEARSTVRVPCVDRNLWKAAKVSTEPSRKLNNPECFQLWLTRQRTFLTKNLKPSLVLRYVDSSKNIREEFSGVRHCWEETTGNAIKELITNSVRDLGLIMDNCGGQSYDGAGNMAGWFYYWTNFFWWKLVTQISGSTPVMDSFLFIPVQYIKRSLRKRTFELKSKTSKINLQFGTSGDNSFS